MGRHICLNLDLALGDLGVKNISLSTLSLTFPGQWKCYFCPFLKFIEQLLCKLGINKCLFLRVKGLAGEAQASYCIWLKEALPFLQYNVSYEDIPLVTPSWKISSWSNHPHTSTHMQTERDEVFPLQSQEGVLFWFCGSTAITLSLQ